MDTPFFSLNRDLLRLQLVALLRVSRDAAMGPDRLTEMPGRVRALPEAIRESATNTIPITGLAFSMEESRVYDDLFYYLTCLRETEWQTPTTLDQKLWELVCEVSLTPTEYADESALRAMAEQFMGGVLRELRQYRVLFTVHHIAPPREPVAVWDAQLVTATRDLLTPFVAEAAPEWRYQRMSPFLDHTAIIVTVDGTAETAAIEHARQLATHRLHVLRSLLAMDQHTGYRQLLFMLGDHALVAPRGLMTWQAPPTMAVDLEIHAGHSERLSEMQNLFTSLTESHSSVGAAIERAIEWIGRGLCRSLPGDAIRDYTTAVEVLLISGDREQKSVLVPYRMLVLGDLHGRPTLHPTIIRVAYDRRSIVVHEGLALAGEDVSTQRMLAAACDCVGWVVNFASMQPKDDHASLLRALDTPSARAKAITWLRAFRDPWTQRLVAGIESLPR